MKGNEEATRPNSAWLVVFLAAVLFHPAAQAAETLQLPPPDPTLPITITAGSGYRQQYGTVTLWILERGVSIEQGKCSVTGRSAVIWINRPEPWQLKPTVATAYLEGDVRLQWDTGNTKARITDRRWSGQFTSTSNITVQVSKENELTADSDPAVAFPLYKRAVVYRLQSPDPPQRMPAAEPIISPPAEPVPLPKITARRISVFPRSDVPVQFQWEHDPATDQWVAIITSGVNLIVTGISGLEAGPVEIDSIDVSTDRLVIWTTAPEEPDLSGQRPQPANLPLEIYMEGNVIFRQGERIIYADRMYYDVTNRVGIVLGAEILTPVRDFQGMIRLRAEVLRQLGPDRFLAQNAYATSSRLGLPGYRIQSEQVYFEDVQQPAFDPVTGMPVVDPLTQEPLIEHNRLITSRNNWVFLGQVPVFYWPWLASDLRKPTFYVRKLRLKNDSVFGTQVLSDWDMYQLLGIQNRPEGTDWTASLDVLTDRGLGHGMNFIYRRENLFELGPASGLVDFWGIQDDGIDNLGEDRRAVEPEKNYRWRLLWQHRQRFPSGWELTAEAGWISDRNFLEQYYEQEWDELKDQTTGVLLRRAEGIWSLNISADYRLNNFFTQTDWLPRADHFLLGADLFGRLTWFEHTSVGFARFNTAHAPEVPAPVFRFLPWETSNGVTPLDVSGERVITRHELDLPLLVGPVKFVPYAIGEVAHWGSDRTGDDLQRLYAQLGVRASLPMWKVDPFVENRLLNLHGLAHKALLEMEVAWCDASRDLDQLPLYDPLDDDAIEVFRRRFLPGVIYPVLDERYYAVRAGMAGWVTAPSMEVVDDLLAVRLGTEQRWQTKRGLPDQMHVIDWLTIEANGVIYPRESRDNFGRTIGLVDYSVDWQLGNRLALVSTGMFDFFPNGQRLITFGGYLDRPPRGNLYLGLHILDGPLSSNVLAFAYSYRMSPKWISSFSTTIDLAGDGNIGQNLAVTRIGESFLVSLNVSIDAGRDNVSAGLVIEPRFLPRSRLGFPTGAQIPAPGAYGFE